MASLALPGYYPQLLALPQKRKTGQVVALRRAKKDALHGFSRILRKRQKIQKTRKASSVELLSKMERGWMQPYLIGYHIRKGIAQKLNSSQNPYEI